jgi:hypothetical protein
VISDRHAYELVAARRVSITVDGLIVAAGMLILDASRRAQPAHNPDHT